MFTCTDKRNKNFLEQFSFLSNIGTGWCRQKILHCCKSVYTHAWTNPSVENIQQLRGNTSYFYYLTVSLVLTWHDSKGHFNSWWHTHNQQLKKVQNFKTQFMIKKGCNFFYKFVKSHCHHLLSALKKLLTRKNKTRSIFWLQFSFFSATLLIICVNICQTP